MSENEDNPARIPNGRVSMKLSEHVGFEKLTLNSPRSPLGRLNAANMGNSRSNLIESPQTPRALYKRKCVSSVASENVYTSTPKSSKGSGMSNGTPNGPVLKAKRSDNKKIRSLTLTPIKYSGSHSSSETIPKLNSKNQVSGVEGPLSSAISDLFDKPILGLSPLFEEAESVGSRRQVEVPIFSTIANAKSADQPDYVRKIGDAFKRPIPLDEECFAFQYKRAKSSICEATNFFREHLSDTDDDQSEAENSFTGVTGKTPFPSQPAMKFSRSVSESVVSVCVKSVVERIDSDPTLVGDGSRSHVLPVIPDGEHKHSDLKEITGDTLVQLIQGKFNEQIDGFEVVDCRYPYEFKGGHIVNSINLFTKKQIFERYMMPKVAMKLGTGGTGLKSQQGCEIIIFHCEFSSVRGPEMCRFLRSSDRNENDYPSLYYPELYVLSGGYKAFFEKFKMYCEPQLYVPMVDENHVEECRLFKSLSKTDVGNTKKGKPPSKIIRQTSTKKLGFD